VGPVLGLLVAVLGALGGPVAPAPGLAGPSIGVDPFSSGFTVSISASSMLAEPGVPVAFSAVVSGGLAPITFLWTDSANESGDSQNFTGFPVVVGNLSVTLEARDAFGAVAAASYREDVVPSVTASIAVANTSDVGAPFSLTLSVANGAGPYRVNGSIAGGPMLRENLTTAGSYPLPAWSVLPGPVNLSLSVTDRIGGSARIEALAQPLAPAPSIALVAGPVAVEAGVAYPWWASVTGGTPPIAWTVQCLGGMSNVSGQRTVTGSPATLAYTASFNVSGNSSIHLDAVDAIGVATSVDLPVRVAPALTAYLSDGVGGPGTFNVTLAGGVAPFEIFLTGASGLVWIGNASADGTFSVHLAGGSLPAGNVSVRVTDAAGGSSEATAPTIASAPPPPPPSTSGASASRELPVAVAATLVVGIAGALLGRRFLPPRSGTPPTPPPAVAATEEVRRLLQDSSAMERGTVLLMGENRGVSRDSLEAGLDHWVRQGKIEITRAPGGEEFLRWRDEPGPRPGGDR